MNSKCCVQLCGFTSKAWPAGPVLANKRTPRWGCSWLLNAIELRLFYTTESRLFYATESRLFYARYAIVWRTMCECWCAVGAAEHSGGEWRLVVDYSLITNFSAVFIKLKQVSDYWLLIISIIWDGVTTFGVTGKCFKLPVTRKESSILNETS